MDERRPETVAPVARRVVVRGRVQGVGFRWHARVRAREIGIAGWVKNLSDGSVEAHVEGVPERVQSMIAWLRRGPPAARVDALEERETALEHRRDFGVER